MQSFEGTDSISSLAEAEAKLADTPDHLGAIFKKATCLAGTGDIVAAIEWLDRGERLSGGQSLFPFHLAQMLRDSGDVAGALAAFERAARCPDADDGVTQAWAELLKNNGELKAAIEIFGRIAPESLLFQSAQASISAVRELIAKSRRKLASHLIWLDADSRYPAPYVAFTGRPFGDGGRLDAWGFPNAAPPTREKPEGEKRVFVVGDSCVFAEDPEGRVTLTDLMQQKLAALGHNRLKVFNFGVRSALAHQMLSLVFFKLIDYKPDLILICCGGSNIFAPLSYDPRPGHPYNSYVIEELYTKFFDFSNTNPDDVSVGYEDLIDGLATRHAELRRKTGWNTPEWEEDIVRSFAEFVDKTSKIALGYSSKISVILSPMVNTKASITEDERLLVQPDTFDYFVRQYGRIFKIMAGNAHSNLFFKVEDASTIFDNVSGSIFTDFIHYNLRGKNIMADYLSQHAVQRLAQVDVTVG